MTRHIRKIVDGLRYDTATATEICTFENGEYQSNFRYESTALYRTRKGRFFLAGYGGPMSSWACSVRDGRTGGEGLRPVGIEEARAFAEAHGDADTVEQFFDVEEA